MESIGQKLANSEISNSSKQDNKIIDSSNNTVPDQVCSIYSSFLNNNYDFFYNYIYGPIEDKNCQKLFTHLNNCYSCFCIFSHTMREYFHKKNEKTVKAKGVAQ